MRSRRLLDALALAALISCGPPTEIGSPVVEGPSTETGNPTLTGIVRDTGGLRAGGALVVLYRLPQGPADSAVNRPPDRIRAVRAGLDGSYRFDSLAEGRRYALQAADSSRGLLALLPSAEIPAGAKGFLRKDTLVLKRPGRLEGTARRDRNARPAGVIADEDIQVRVAGTERVTYTDTAGRYVLGDVPSGVFTVAFAAADGHYLPWRLDSVAVAPGDTVALPGVILPWSPVAEPPAPAGLVATLDSAAGVMRLRWQAVSLSNFDHYRILRRDSVTAAVDTFRTADTVYVDTVGHLPAGRVPRYAVVAVNKLGNAGPEHVLRNVPVPGPSDPLPTGSITVRVVGAGNLPAQATVRLHAIAAEPGPPDSLPRRPRLRDSARTGADGGASFSGIPAGRYSVVAVAGDGRLGALVGLSPRATPLPEVVTLDLPGALAGVATRQRLWCSHEKKGNENIDILVAGLPYSAATSFDGRFTLSGVPAGRHRLVVHALPTGCFLPDTLETSIEAGRTTVLDTVPARANPGFIPMVTGLAIRDSGRGSVHLAWNAVPAAWTGLKAYEAVRRDSAQNILATSGPISGTAWTDDISAVPSGTRLFYVVRVIAMSGAAGRFGGREEGKGAVEFTVP